MTTYVVMSDLATNYNEFMGIVHLDAKIVGNVIQRFRRERGFSQEVLSGFAGIGRTHLSAIECGDRKPTLETFFRISEALEVKTSDLFSAIEKEIYSSGSCGNKSL